MMNDKQIIERDDDEGEVVEFKVRVDLETVAWLCELANACHQQPASVIASLVKDIRRDDEAAHDFAPRSTPSGATLN